MNKEEFERSKDELEKEKEQNNEQIRISDERMRMLKVNSLEYKAEITSVFSIVASVVLLLISLIPLKSLGTSIITNFIYPIALIGSSLGIGTIGRILLDKKYQTKERLKAFSTAKTQAEKLEEEVHYQIELEKANNRNKAIDESIKVLNANQTMLSRISGRYDLYDRTAPQTKEEAQQKLEELTNIMKEQYEKLDLFTTKKVLQDRFREIRQKYLRRQTTMFVTMISGVFTMTIATFPILMVPSSSVLARLTVPIVSLITGIVGSSAYMSKRNKDHRKVFDNLNSQLGENALIENLDKKIESDLEEQKEIETLIENQIRNISLTEVQLQETKRHLDTHITGEDILSQSFPQLKETEKMRKDFLNPSEKYTNYEENLNESLSSGEEKGPTLVKRRK